MSNIRICDGCGKKINVFADAFWTASFEGPNFTMNIDTLDKDLCMNCWKKVMRYLKEEGEKDPWK